MGRLIYREYVLVTGATGYIGAHIVDELLRRGLRVRGTARSQHKAEEMLRARAQYAERLDFVLVKDLTEPGGFDDAAKGVDAIIHTASVSLAIVWSFKLFVFIILTFSR